MNQKSAYVSVFDDTINFALQFNTNLWTTEELNILQLCSEGSLSEGSRLILSRLSLRKSKWLKSSSISHYIPYGSEPSIQTTEIFNQSLDILEQNDFIEYITSKTSFEIVFEAVRACFLLDDLTLLYKKLTTKNITHGNKTMNKERLIESIHHAVSTQKTLFGQPLYHKFSTTVMEVLKEISHISKSPHHKHTVSNLHKESSSKNILRVLRIQPKILDLLRRCQRLYQISCNASNNGYSGSTTTSSSASTGRYNSYNSNSGSSSSALATVINTSAASTGFASVLQPLEFHAPLLVFFQKVRYPQYVLRCGKGLVEANTKSSSIFASQLGFLQWEGAVELHAACLDPDIEATLLCGTSNSKRLVDILTTFDKLYYCPYYTALAAHPTGDALFGSTSKPAGWNILPWIASILSSALPQHCESTTVFSSTTATTDDADAGDGKAPIKKKRNCSDIDLTALLPAHLLSILCLLSYSSAGDSHSDCSSATISSDSSGGTHGSCSRSDYMLKFDAGTQLAYACSDGATQCEKEPYRQYSVAILLYELLLLLPYLPHRRGLWYKRLCINYAHLQLYRCALRACYRCQADAGVNVSDKTDLVHRATGLQARLSKKLNTTPKVPNTKESVKKSKRGAVATLSSTAAEEAASASNFPLSLDFPEVHTALSLEKIASAVVKADHIDPSLVQEHSADGVSADRRSKRARKSKVKTQTSALNTSAEGSSETVNCRVPYSSSTEMDAVLDSCSQALQVLYVVNMLPICRTCIGSDTNSSTTGSSMEKSCSSRTVPAQPLREFISSFLTLTIVRTVTSNIQQQQAHAPTITVQPNTTTSLSNQQQSNSYNTDMDRDTGNAAGIQASLKKHTDWQAQARPSGSKRRKLTAKASQLTLSTSTPPVEVLSGAFWSCTVCTFVNAHTQTIACAVCMHARPSTVKCHNSAKNKSNSGSIARSASADPKPVADVKTAMANSTTTVVEVVDLLSDEDEEVQVVKGKEVQVVKDKEVQVVEVDTHYAKKTEKSSNSHSHPPPATDKSASSGTITTTATLPTQQQQNTENQTQNVCMLLYNIYSCQLTKALKTIKAQTKPLQNPQNRVDTMQYNLNIYTSIRNANDEETDLLLLDLLPNTHLTTNMHLSLEELIPAPPFFVVHGKRMGDPTRKGKSRFCGRSGELLHVEEYVLEKCYSLDPDEILPDGVSLSVNPTSAVVLSEESREEILIHSQQQQHQEEEDDMVEAMEIEPVSHPRRARRSCRADAGTSTTTTTTTASVDISIQATDVDDVKHEDIVQRDAKTLRQVDYSTAIAGGGWQGWHCEGAIFHTLFGLLLWDILFTCPCAGSVHTASSQCCNESSGKKSSSGSCTVFVTPFQDAPLDLGHRAFFRSRKDAILLRIAEIAACSTEQLQARLAGTYREHYGETCRSVSWGMTLPLLQLVAVCMGAKTVAAVCRAMAVNFKHFNGGAPDLLLVRVQRRTVRTMPCHCTDCVDAGVETVALEEYRCVDLSEVLGQDWAEQTHREVRLGTARPRPDEVPQEVFSSYQNTTRTAGTVESSLLESGSEEQRETEWDGAPSVPAIDTSLPLYQKNMHMHDLFLPHLAPIPDTLSVPSLCRHCQSAISSKNIVYSYDYRLQARYVEVKGPSDTLMFRQRVWLHILNQAATAAADGIQLPQAYVCHVKE